MKTMVRTIAVLSLLTLSAGFLYAGSNPSKAQPATSAKAKPDVDHGSTPLMRRGNASSAPLLKEFGRGPLRFEANAGQFDPQVKFASRGMNHTLFLTANDAVLVLPGKATPVQGRERGSRAKSEISRSEGAVARLRLVGSNTAPEISGDGLLAGKSNYLLGRDAQKWHTGVANYSRVRYHEIYPGIDWVHYGNQGMLEFDFVVSPGADPSRINVALDVTRGGSAQALRLGEEGDLLVAAGSSDLRFRRPVVYQEVEGKRQIIPAAYVLRAGGQVGFELDAYDRTKTLIIDPVLSFSSYLGGGNYDSVAGVAVDSTGIYVTGQTASLSFPTTPSAFQPNPGVGAFNCFGPGCYDAFVSKLTLDGTTLIYSTFLGGNSTDGANSIAVDGSGNAYVTGSTSSLDFPVTATAFQSSFASSGSCSTCNDAFVAKLDSTGSNLLYATYLGGANEDDGYSIAVDSSGKVYVTGFTTSASFPVTSGTFTVSTCANGTSTFACGDAFVAKFDPTQSGAASRVYSRYVGGDGDDYGFGIAVDPSGNAYIAGTTYTNTTPDNNFPTTVNAYRTAFQGGNSDAFFAKLNSSGTVLYATFLGGTDDEQATAVALDSTSKAYVVGWTASTTNFPVKNAFQGTFDASNCSGCNDAFVAKIDATLTGANSLIYSTYLGGSNDDRATAVAVDTSGNAYVAGGTASTQVDVKPFPLVNPVQSENDGNYDVFVSALNAAGSSLLFSTYLGGSQFDAAFGIAVNSGKVVVGGKVNSSDFPAYPVAPQPFQPAFGGGGTDGFVFVIDTAHDVPGVSLSSTSVNFGHVGVLRTSPTQTLILRNVGSAALTISSISLSGADPGEFTEDSTACGTSVPVGGNCSINLTFKPTSIGPKSATLVITDDAAGSPHQVSLSGTGISGADASLSTASLSFGNQQVGTTSAAQTITVTSSGTQNLVISTVLPSSPDYSASGCTSATLAPGASCTISVTFKPSTTGAINATLTINDNTAAAKETVSLTGTGYVIDFAVTVASSSGPVNAGSSASYDLTLTPSGGFHSAVQFTCTGAPTAANCSVSPNPATPTDGLTPVPVTVTVSTTKRSAAPPAVGPVMRPPHMKGIPWLLVLWMLVLMSAVILSKRWRAGLALTAMLLMVMTWVACGGGGGGGGTPPPPTGTPAGTYTLKVTATSGSLSHPVNLTLTVN